jgi:hypothetical protein
MDEAFTAEMTSGYAFDEPCVILGRPMKDGEVETGAMVQLPLSMMNRHGLVAGATGTGKTKTLQIMAGLALGRQRARLHLRRQGRRDRALAPG